MPATRKTLLANVGSVFINCTWFTTDTPLSRNEDLADLNNGFDVGVVWHITLKRGSVGNKSGQEVFHRIKQEMAHRDVCRIGPRFSAAKPALDGNAFETGMGAQERNRHRHVGVD